MEKFFNSYKYDSIRKVVRESVCCLLIATTETNWSYHMKLLIFLDNFHDSSLKRVQLFLQRQIAAKLQSQLRRKPKKGNCKRTKERKSSEAGCSKADNH